MNLGATLINATTASKYISFFIVPIDILFELNDAKITDAKAKTNILTNSDKYVLTTCFNHLANIPFLAEFGSI